MKTTKLEYKLSSRTRFYDYRENNEYFCAKVCYTGIEKHYGRIKPGTKIWLIITDEKTAEGIKVNKGRNIGVVLPFLRLALKDSGFVKYDDTGSDERCIAIKNYWWWVEVEA